MDRASDVAKSRLVGFRRQLASLLAGQRAPAFPNHEKRNAAVDNNRHDADDEIDVSAALQHFDELRTHFSPANGADSHDKAEPQVNVAQGAMTFCSDDGFADDVG